MDRFTIGLICFLLVFAGLVGIAITWALFIAIGGAILFYSTCYWLLGGRIYVRKNNRNLGYYQWFWYVPLKPY